MKFPLMRNNILRSELDAVIEHLKQDDPILTNGPNCRAFEEEWSKWLGVKYSVFVNSGASANLLSMTVLKIQNPFGGEVIVDGQLNIFAYDQEGCMLNFQFVQQKQGRLIKEIY